MFIITNQNNNVLMFKPFSSQNCHQRPNIKFYRIQPESCHYGGKNIPLLKLFCTGQVYKPLVSNILLRLKYLNLIYDHQPPPFTVTVKAQDLL